MDQSFIRCNRLHLQWWSQYGTVINVMHASRDLYYIGDSSSNGDSRKSLLLWQTWLVLISNTPTWYSQGNLVLVPKCLVWCGRREHLSILGHCRILNRFRDLLKHIRSLISIIQRKHLLKDQRWHDVSFTTHQPSLRLATFWV